MSPPPPEGTTNSYWPSTRRARNPTRAPTSAPRSRPDSRPPKPALGPASFASAGASSRSKEAALARAHSARVTTATAGSPDQGSRVSSATKAAACEMTAGAWRASRAKW